MLLHFGLPFSTLTMILSKTTEIRKQSSKFGTSRTKFKSGRESSFKEIEDVLFSWYQQARASNIPVDREKRPQIALRFGVENLSVSNGWLTGFKVCHCVGCKKLFGEISAVSNKTAHRWFCNLPKILEGYKPEDICNANETGLFYNCLRNKTFSIKGEVCQGGKIPLKNTKFLHFKYCANKKALMIVMIFTFFLHALSNRMGVCSRKMFVNNCAAHPKGVTFLRYVKMVFYPPNCTSMCLPLDMGVIKCLKHEFQRMLVWKFVGLLDTKSEDSRVELKLNFLQAIHYVASTWRKIRLPPQQF
ncbi:hypothetical protein PR048_009709 [Dryococelus australis]|uniref:HTH CENPB-type domain-containing protein n=1 Tax=Dryococelus australis TaxID=614101 RepID=A0ABQ9I0N6_9NEOP|nr:hypothetical protein PR048_009709 [Dryococelus australis]